MCWCENERKINILCLRRPEVISDSQELRMTDHFINGPNTELCHNCPELISNIIKEVDDMLRGAFKLLSQNGILGSYSNRACIQVTLAHHDAPHSNQRCRGKPPLFGS